MNTAAFLRPTIALLLASVLLISSTTLPVSWGEADTLALTPSSLTPPMATAPIALLDLLQQVAQQNLPLKAAHARLESARANIRAAGLWQNPTLLSDNGIAEYTYRAGIEQTFPTGGKRKYAILQAKADFETAACDYNQQLLDTLHEARQLFIKVCFAQKNQDANTLQELQQSLNLLRNQPLDTPLPAFNLNSVTPVALTADTLLTQAQQQHPQLLQCKAKLLSIQHQTQLALRSAIPDISITSGPDMIVQDGNHESFFIIVSCKLPVWDHGQVARLQAEQEHQALQYEYQHAQNQIRYNVLASLRQLAQQAPNTQDYYLALANVHYALGTGL